MVLLVNKISGTISKFFIGFQKTLIHNRMHYIDNALGFGVKEENQQKILQFEYHKRLLQQKSHTQLYKRSLFIWFSVFVKFLTLLIYLI